MQELIDAIVANPDDDLPRLVYADWLEENNQPEYARWLRDSLVNISSWETRKGDPAIIIPDGVTEIEIAPAVANVSWLIKRGFPSIAYLHGKIPEDVMNHLRSTLPIKFQEY